MKNKSRRKKSNYEEITSLKTLTIKHMSVRYYTNGVLYYTKKLEKKIFQ